MTLHSENTGVSRHASARTQQRGIPPLILDWLIAYGEEQPDHHGARVVYFTKRSRQRISQDAGDIIVRRLHEFLDAYAVIAADGCVITCGHRFKKIYKH